MENEGTKLSLKEKILQKLNTDTLKSFFMGKWYPVLVAALVFLGHTFEIEIYLCLINMILFAMAMIICDSVRPFIITLCTFTWQLPLAHSPAGPVWSDNFINGANPYIFGLSILIIIATFIYMIIKHKVLTSLSFKSTPMLISTLGLSLAFILNGAFSSTWQPKDLLYGAIQALIFPFIFLMFYRGLKSERDFEKLGLYIAYVASVMGVLFALEMADLYIIGNDYYGKIFDSSGSVIKDMVHLGWATWNPAGISAALLIPAIFYGAIKGKHSWAYFLSACITYVSVVLTFSRNSMIMATLALAASVIIACFYGEKRRKTAYRIVTGCGILAVIFFVVVFWREIRVFASDIFNRGFDSNGRLDLWALAIKNFKAHPVFGTGFYYFSPMSYIAYTPAMPLFAHQTFLQLLCSMGFVGLLAYLYYRIESAQMFLTKPTILKSMLGMSVLVLLAGSLIDNFIFNIFTTFFYGAELAVTALIYEKQLEDEKLSRPMLHPHFRNAGKRKKKRKKKK